MGVQEPSPFFRVGPRTDDTVIDGNFTGENDDINHNKSWDLEVAIFLEKLL